MLLAVVAASLVAWAAAYALTFRHSSPPSEPSSSVVTGGPLKQVDRQGGSSAIDVGQPVSYGLLFLSNPGGPKSAHPQMAVLEEAKLIKPDPGLALLGMYVKPLTKDNPGIVRGFRRSSGKPVQGWSIKPGQVAQLVVGLRARRPGKSYFRGIGLRYRVGDRRFYWQFSYSGVLCAPETRYARGHGHGYRCRTPLF
jgi:hypothetical protein